MRDHRQIVFGDVTIECTVQGSGETVVLIPGLGGDSNQFDELADSLTRAGYRTVAVNPRGVGGSQGPLENITLHDFADDVANLIHSLGAAPAHVLGRGFGNRVARCVAADHPELVRSVMLLAAGGLVPPEPEAQLAFERSLRQDLAESDRLAALKSALFSPAYTGSPAVVGKASVTAVQVQARASQATPLSSWWAGGVAPILVVQGLDDRMAPPVNGRALRDQLGERVRLVEVPAAGHAVHFEQPKRVTEAVVSFLRDHS